MQHLAGRLQLRFFRGQRLLALSTTTHPPTKSKCGCKLERRKRRPTQCSGHKKTVVSLATYRPSSLPARPFVSRELQFKTTPMGFLSKSTKILHSPSRSLWSFRPYPHSTTDGCPQSYCPDPLGIPRSGTPKDLLVSPIETIVDILWGDSMVPILGSLTWGVRGTL